ncbi:related to 2-deoxy-D-gluconate 3-dehydrogenase [Fusarium fujikuroi]|nr:related to 2-deoxy-D-gluconate 3-dehydrogenase [Fusarium fujikuroi]
MAPSAQVISSYLASLFSLAGKVAVVTGGSSGIGREMAIALGRAGCRIVLVARRPKPLQDTIDHLADLHVTAEAIVADLSDQASVRDAIHAIKTNAGTPDILVNAAGVNYRPHMNDLSQGAWDETIAVNLTTPFTLGQAFGPKMAEKGWGRIINIISQQSFRAFGNSGAYGASKAGLLGLTRSQAEAWSKHGVLCNAIAPGLVDTPLARATFNDPGKADAHAARTMIGRNGLPKDFAGVAVWLASDASAAVTGQTIFVDGGYSST